MMFDIVCFLDFSSAICFPERLDHRFSKIICIQDHFTIRISGSTSDNLDERCRRTEKSLFISIKYRQQRDFRQIQSFSEQIDAHDDIDNSCFQFFDNLPTIDRSYLTMQIECLISFGYKKRCYLFRRFFRKSKQEYFPSFRNMAVHLRQQMFQKCRLLIAYRSDIFLEKIWEI